MCFFPRGAVSCKVDQDSRWRAVNRRARDHDDEARMRIWWIASVKKPSFHRSFGVSLDVIWGRERTTSYFPKLAAVARQVYGPMQAVDRVGWLLGCGWLIRRLATAATCGGSYV